jgi:hypothetical protein
LSEQGRLSGPFVTSPTGERIVRPPEQRKGVVLALLTDRLPTKLAALFLAIVLWVVVRGEEPTEIIIGARFVATVDNSLEVTGPLPDSVQVIVSGPRWEVLKLRANPPVVRRRFDADTPRRIRVTLQTADVEFPIGVQATAKSIRPAAVTLNFRPRVRGGSQEP